MTGDYPPTPEFGAFPPEPGVLFVNQNNVLSFNMGAPGATLTLHPSPSELVLTISGIDGDIATIGQDGTVKLTKEGSAPEAAQAFWQCISLCYQGIMAERDALKLQVEDLLEEIQSLEEEYNDMKSDFWDFP